MIIMFCNFIQSNARHQFLVRAIELSVMRMSVNIVVFPPEIKKTKQNKTHAFWNMCEEFHLIAPTNTTNIPSSPHHCLTVKILCKDSSYI